MWCGHYKKWTQLLRPFKSAMTRTAAGRSKLYCSSSERHHSFRPHEIRCTSVSLVTSSIRVIPRCNRVRLDHLTIWVINQHRGGHNAKFHRRQYQSPSWGTNVWCRKFKLGVMLRTISLRFNDKHIDLITIFN